MTEQLNVQQMAERLCAADNILVLCHKNPDGDTIGCGSALCHALKALGKTAAVLCSDAVPSRYSFTAPVPFRGEFEPKTVVAVDVASVQLFGENNGVPQYTRHVDLCIDHHTGNSGYADFTLLDGNAAAAAELLYEVISEMGVEITPLIANCLYTGLATDTGCFRFSSTTANTHLVAAQLILAGAQVEELNTLLFDTKPRERMEAERIARNHLEYHLEGRCALMYLTRDEIEQSGVDPADLEELTSLPISIEGVKVGLLLRQQPVAGDLRRISTTMKVVTDVERIGDHASDIAEIIPHLVTVRKEGDPAVSQAIKMGQKAHKMILDALNALTSEDEQAALKVIAADDEVDYDFNAIKHTLAQEIAADPGKVDAALDLLMVIKYLERIGDHAVNLAEWVEFVRSGRYHNENMF